MTDSPETDPRADAVAERLRSGNWYPSEYEGHPMGISRWCRRAAAAVIESIDAADEASGVRRVTAQELAAIRAEEQRRFHVPQIAEARTGFGVFCAACSAAVGDYIYPCKLPDGGYWSRIPNSLAAADSPVGGVS